jgi:hypothetical protein
MAVAFQTQDSCHSSWIMAQGQMKGIHLFFIIFLESLPINYTTLKLATYLEEALGNTKYHHQDRGIPNARFMSDLLDHGSRTNERDPSIFIIFLESLPMNHTTLKYGLPRRGIRNDKISSPGAWHSKHKIHVSPLGLWLKDN